MIVNCFFALFCLVFTNLFAGTGASQTISGDGGRATAATISSVEAISGNSGGVVVINDSGEWWVS